MIRSISRRCWFGLLGLVWLSATSAADAQSPFKFSTFRVNVHVEMSTTPDPLRPTAPWYAYFPADPRLLPSPQVTPYPPWPMQFPPPGPPADGQKRSSVAPVPQGPMLTRYWPNPIAYGSSLQPVGYYAPVQAPSYWYRGR